MSADSALGGACPDTMVAAESRYSPSPQQRGRGFPLNELRSPAVSVMSVSGFVRGSKGLLLCGKMPSSSQPLLAIESGTTVW